MGRARRKISRKIYREKSQSFRMGYRKGAGRAFRKAKKIFRRR